MAQRRMTAALPCEKVITMDASHNPYLSAPATLANQLLALPVTLERQQAL